ncbi:MAG: hypothetical protein MUP90_11625 [Gammaproteobacteria bacterium]|nr:hypothetical protein [Gammaproteobacteria bacterium]
MLTLRDAIYELTYPLRDVAMLLELIVFWVLFTIAIFAGLLGLWLLVAIVPAFFQYLLVVMQARAHGKEAPAVDVELFSWAQKLWSLFPMALVTLAAAGVYFLVKAGHGAWAVLAAALAVMVLPLSLAVLTTTHSALQCLRPSQLWLVARGWGRHYALVLVVSMVGALLAYLALEFDFPLVFLGLFILYGFLLVASVGGHAMAIQDVPIEVSIPDPVFPSAQELLKKVNQVRTRTLNHAYGMVSRGNRAGGVRHVLGDIQDSPDQVESSYWFFTEMLRWESTDAACLIGQRLISLLLAEQRDQEAIKTLVRCRHANQEFKLLERDRVLASRLAKQVHDPELKVWLESCGA